MTTWDIGRWLAPTTWDVLFPADAAGIEEAQRWPLRRDLVMVLCAKCGEKVLLVSEHLAHDPDDDQEYVLCFLGPIVQGTRKSKGQQLDIAKQDAAAEGRRLGRKVPMWDDWWALLDKVPTPSLPGWCDRHGALAIPTGLLRHHAALISAARDAEPAHIRGGPPWTVTRQVG